MSRRLLDIGDDLIALDELLAEVGGEVTDAQAEEAIDAFLKELGDEAEIKLTGYGNFIKNLELDAAGYKSEANRLDALAKSSENNAKRLKARLKFFLESIKKTEWKVSNRKFKIQNNGGKRPVSVNPAYLAHPEELPEGYRRVTFSPDMDNLGTDLAELERMREELAGMESLMETAHENQIEVPESDMKQYLELKEAVEQLANDLEGLATLEERGTHLRLY